MTFSRASLGPTLHMANGIWGSHEALVGWRAGFWDRAALRSSRDINLQMKIRLHERNRGQTHLWDGCRVLGTSAYRWD